MARQAVVIVEAVVTAIIREERIGGQRLLLGDCLEVMKELGRFDAVVTDPPYGMGDKLFGGKSSRWGRLHTEKGGFTWDQNAPSFVPDLISFADNSIIWGGNFFALPPSRAWLVWNKIVRNFSSSVCELAWTNLDRPIDAFDFSHGQLASEGKQHPTQKPLALMEWCLGFVPKAKTILDPFAGSGTTAVACERMGRQCTAIELDPDYFEIACKRVEEATRQKDLFVAAPERPKQETLL